MIKDYKDYLSQFNTFRIDYNKVSSELHEIEDIQKYLKDHGVSYDEDKMDHIKNDLLSKLRDLYELHDKLGEELMELRLSCPHTETTPARGGYSNHQGVRCNHCGQFIEKL